MTAKVSFAKLFAGAKQALEAADLTKALELGQMMEQEKADNPETWIVLAHAYLGLKRWEKAAGYFLALHEKDPENFAYRHKLTEIYCAVEYYDKAVDMYRPVFENSSKTCDRYLFFGDLCLRGGCEEEGLEYLAEAEKMAPENPEIKLLRARGHIALGDISAAAKLTLEVLQNHPGKPEALMLKADLGLEFEEQEIQRLEGILGDHSLPPGSRADGGLVLGKILTAKGRYDEAFAAVKTAKNMLNQIFISQGAEFDVTREKQVFKENIGLYSNAYLKTLPRGISPSLQPLFIIGLPRSGTTLVEQILGAHSKIFRGGEMKTLGEFPILLKGLSKSPKISDRQKAIAENLGHWRQAFFAELTKKAAPGTRFVTDKMPANFENVGLAFALFPNARFVFLEREPMDTCLSMFFHPLAASYPATVSLEKLAAYYRLFQDYLKAWRGLEGLKYHDLCYEDLVQNPEAEIKKLIDFTGLPWEDACLNFHQAKGPVRTLSNLQVRKPMTKAAVGRWKNFETHLTPLKRALGKQESK